MSRNQNKRLWHAILVQADYVHCLKCGYDACVSALDYHHRDPETKTFQPAALMQGYKPTPERVTKLLEETVCLCSRCHREFHAGMWSLEAIPPLKPRGHISFEDPWKPEFTPRQSQIFGLLSSGKTRAQIAEQLGITRQNLRGIIRHMRKRAKGKSHI